MRFWVSSVAVLASLCSSPDLLAQPSEMDKGLAQSLFDQGKQLMDAGSFASACPKLQESQRLDPGGGTLLNLALCHEREGKIATAWAEFKEALAIARRDDHEARIEAAEQHIAALAPRLPWLTINVASDVPEQEIRLDGAILSKVAWGGPLAVDPGPHEVIASAPARKAWSLKLTMAPAEKRALSVPPLDTEASQGKPAVADKPAPPTLPQRPTPAPPSPHREAKSSGAAGWIVGGAGVVALGVGGYFGLQTLSKKQESDELCPTDTTCTNEGVTRNDQAHTAAWISNIGIGLGLLGVGVGTYLVLSADSDSNEGAVAEPTLALGTRVGAAGGSLELRGTW